MVSYLLDFTFRNQDTRNIRIYDNIKKDIISNLRPHEIIDLWLGEYIDLSKEQVLNYFDFDDDKQVQKRFDKVESSIERLSTSVKSKFVSIDNKIIKILEDNYKKSTARKKSISVMQSVINVFSNDREGLRDELQKEKILNIKLQKTTKISLFIAVVALMLSLLIAAILFLK